MAAPRFAVLRPWLLFATAALVGCGGSSSETPPPLSPDPLHAAYRPESAVGRAAGNRRPGNKAEPASNDPSAVAPSAGGSPEPATSAE